MKPQIRFRLFFPATILLVFLGGTITVAQEPKPENATNAIVRAFKTHNIVMLGEFHGNKQLYEWLRQLVATPAFADRVDDIVMEFGNSLYQKSVDEYGSGKEVPIEKVERAWRNTVGEIGPPSPVTEWLYRAVREANMKRRGKHQMRILCGDPYIDWEKAETMKDVNPYMAHRDDWYAQVVKDEVIARHHRALLIMGAMHFLRNNQIGAMSATIEPELQQAGAKPYLIVAGTNTIGGYDDVDHRFDAWKAPAIAAATGWLGELPVNPLTNGGVDSLIINMKDESGKEIKKPSFTELKLKDAADALLYLGPRDSLTVVEMTRAEMEGTPYDKELRRRMQIEKIFGLSPDDLYAEKAESPQFPRPKPEENAPLPEIKVSPASPSPAGAAPSSAPPKRKFTPPPLPPRPPSQ
jgi:hypothetical protein